MINSLLSVGLLLMGVGAKASTPVNLNRQETTQKQQRQLQEQNNSETFQYIMGVPTPTYQTSLDFSTPTGYNWSYGTQSFTNDVYRLTNYTYTYTGPLYDVSQGTNDPVYWGLLEYETGGVYKADVWTLEPNMLVYNNDFVKNVRLNLIPLNEEVTFNIKLELYQSTDPAFEEVCEWSTYEYHVDTIDNLLNGGTIRNYQKTIQTYQFKTSGQTDVYHTFGFDLNIVQGTKNYYALLYSIESIETEGQEEHIELMDAFNSANNGGYCTVFDSTATVIQGVWTPATVTYEYIDLPGLLWEILGMPFTFIGTAFNLTIFPGTPYQINFANLIMIIFGVLVFVFIVGLIRKRS